MSNVFLSKLMVDQRFLSEQRHLTVAADDRHHSILKVVSSTLTTNVGKLLEQTVRLSVEKSILPIITSTVQKSVEQQLAKSLITPLEKTLPKEVRSAVNDTVHKAFLVNDKGVTLSDTIGEIVVGHLEPVVTRELSARLGAMFEQNIVPMIAKMEERMQASIEKSMQQIQKDSSQFQMETTNALETLAETVSSIANQLKVYGKVQVQSPPSTTVTPPIDRNHLEMAEQFKIGKYSSGIEIVLSYFHRVNIQWSDASDDEQAALFDVCLGHDPSILKGLEQLSLMSAMNAISIDFKTHLEIRLLWLEKILTLIKRQVAVLRLPN